MQLAMKGSKEEKVIALTQPSKGVQLGNLLMTYTDMQLINSDRVFTLACSIPAIVVVACATTMVGCL